MVKLNELMAEPQQAGFMKVADVESPDEAQLEQDFANLAFMFLRDRAAALMPHLLGFEVVDREEDGSRAVGIFGFKIANKYYYVPAFFVNNQVKGMDLLYSKENNSFMPLRETWINHILNKSTIRLGEAAGNHKRLREDFEQPNFSFLAEPPSSVKSGQAPAGSWMDYQKAQNAAVRKAMGDPKVGGGYQQWLQSAEGQQNIVGSSPQWRYLHSQHPELAGGITTQLQPLHDQIKARMSSVKALTMAPGIGGSKVAAVVDDGFEVWNNLQGGVVEGMHKDAEFQQALAGAIATLKREHLDLDKTADANPIAVYMQKHGGPRAVRSFMRSVQNPKFASALLHFYPSLAPFKVTEFDAALAPKTAAAKVTVVAHEDSCGDCSNMTDKERKRLVRDGFSIIDRRDDTEKSQLYDIEYPKKFSNPSESGVYKMLLPTGATVEAIVMQAVGEQPGKALLCVEPKNKFFFTADASRVFVAGDKSQDKDPTEDGIDFGDMAIGRRYALVSPKGDASAPFRVEAATAESGERVRIRVYFDTGIDHSNGNQKAWDLPGNYATYGSNTRYLALANHEGKHLRCTGEDLIVPSNWKAIPLTTKWEYEDEVRMKQDKPSATEPAVPASADARNAYDAFAPGNLLDLNENLFKSGFHKIAVGYEGGSDYIVSFEGRMLGPYPYPQAMQTLVTKFGMSVDDAEETLATAVRMRKVAHFIKAGQLVGANVPMPQPPGNTSEDISGMGLPMTEPYLDTSEGALIGQGEWQDSTQPGFATGGQSEMESSMGNDVAALAQQAAATGQKHVFDHASIGGLAKMYDTASAIDMYIPDLLKSLDRVGRILFIFYWKNADFAERYGEEDLAELEDMLRGVFKSYGDLVLKLKQKAITDEDSSDVQIA